MDDFKQQQTNSGYIRSMILDIVTEGEFISSWLQARKTKMPIMNLVSLQTKI